MSQDDPGRTPDPTAPLPPASPPPWSPAQQGGDQPPYGQPASGQPAYEPPPGYEPPPAYGPPPAQPAYPPAGSAPPYGSVPAAPARLLPAGVEAGSMGARLVARLVDLVILSVPVLVVVLALVVPPLATADTDPVTDELVLSDGQQTTLAIGIVLSVLTAIVLPVLYEVGLTAVRGATIGKQLLGLKVVDIDTGGLIGWGRSFVRWVIPFVASFVCLGQIVVYLSCLWDGAKINRGWHDLAARDVVIRTR